MTEKQSKKKPEADRRTGTKEWAKDTINIQLGCEHGCRYCYAREMLVNRFHQLTAEQWLEPEIINSAVDKNYGKFKGIVMFPSTHDITTRNLSQCLCVLKKLLDAGNPVLIVSKPHWNCITLICEALGEYRSQVMFRFTIGTKSNELLRFWEPYAPLFNERLACLKYAYNMRYRTSVSCEPYLDENVVDLYLAVKPWITEDFWLGKLRYFNRRVDQSVLTPEQIDKYVKPLKAAQSDETIWAIYHQLKDERLIKWKDSVREVIAKRG